MVLLSNLETAYNDQQNSFQTQDKGIERVMPNKPGLTGLVDIISGIKRCGKSTYMSQPATLTEGNISFFTFEDSRVFGFDVNDFSKLLQVIGTNKSAYLFDEIQNIKAWELYIRSLHDQGKKSL